MPDLRYLVKAIDDAGELLRIKRPVNPRFELPALLKQAEARRKGVLFENVEGASFAAVGALLTSPPRFAMGLGLPDSAGYSAHDHRDAVFAAIANPLQAALVTQAPCKDVVLQGEAVDLSLLPVPTFFAEDSGPFLTAAVGISRNPDNNILNVGIYRALITGKNQVAVSVGPSSDLLQFLAADKAAGRTTQIALAIGVNPELLMAASAKVPPELSELDVAGGLSGEPLKVTQAETLDMVVPADAEFVLEVEIDHQQYVPNTMGEFGDLYGTQNGHIGKVRVITHRRDPMFHTIMAGAGREHNSLGFIILYDIEPGLKKALSKAYPQVSDLRACFAPPTMGMPGELYLQVTPGSKVSVRELARRVFEMRVGRWDICRVIRKIVVLDADIDINSNDDITWAINNRALTANRHLFFEDLPLPGVGMRMVIDTTVAAEDRERLQRLVIPGSEAINLDDYLDDGRG